MPNVVVYVYLAFSFGPRLALPRHSMPLKRKRKEGHSRLLSPLSARKRPDCYCRRRREARRRQRQDLAFPNRGGQFPDDPGALQPVNEVVDGGVEVRNPIIFLVGKHPVGQLPLGKSRALCLGSVGVLGDEESVQRPLRMEAPAHPGGNILLVEAITGSPLCHKMIMGQKLPQSRINPEDPGIYMGAQAAERTAAGTDSKSSLTRPSALI